MQTTLMSSITAKHNLEIKASVFSHFYSIDINQFLIFIYIHIILKVYMI